MHCAVVREEFFLASNVTMLKCLYSSISIITFYEKKPNNNGHDLDVMDILVWRQLQCAGIAHVVFVLDPTNYIRGSIARRV